MNSIQRWAGRGLAVLTGAVMPVAWLYYLPVFLITAVKAWFTGRRSRTRRAGSDTALGIELRATLLLLPLVSTWTTLSTTIGAHAMASDGTGFFSVGGAWIFGGALLSVTAVLITVHLLHQHRLGIAVAPFERDVDPAAGLAKIAAWRSSRGYLLLPQRDAQAQAWADSVADPDTATQPSFFRAWRLLLDPRAAGFSHFPLMIAGWVLGWGMLELVFGLLGQQDWHDTLYNFFTGALSALSILLCGTAQLVMQGQYRLRLRARKEVLTERLAAAQASPPAPREVDELRTLLAEVLAELQAARSSPSDGTAHTAPPQNPG